MLKFKGLSIIISYQVLKPKEKKIFYRKCHVAYSLKGYILFKNILRRLLSANVKINVAFVYN